MNHFPRKWHDHRDQRQSYWEEIEIDEVMLMEAGDTPQHHLWMRYTSPIGVSHHMRIGKGSDFPA